MISLSTCWNYSPDMNMRDWLRTVKAMGFHALELDYNLTRAHLNELKEAVKQEELQVSSVHNFCPIPNDRPSPRHNSNYYRLSSREEDERKSAVLWTKTTVDTAVEFGAKVVVLHLGAVEFEDERSTPLREMYKAGKKGTEEYQNELTRLMKGRKANQTPYLSAVEKSLEEILPYCAQKGVVLGFESRYYPLEIPNFEEIGYLLKKFHPHGLYYWHDFGHAQMNEKLGIKNNMEYLTAYSEQMIGMHIHDIIGMKDHQAPFIGEMGMEKFASYFSQDFLRVFEVKNATQEEIVAALNRFKKFLE